MSSSSLTSWAVPRLSQLLPLDDESLTQIVTYTAGLSKDASADHLKNLLGDSPAALEFISSFNSRRHGDQTATPTDTSGTDREGESRTTKARKPKKGKQKAALHSAGPPRRPDNYGNIAGGYVKNDNDGDYMASLPSRGGGSSTSGRGDGKAQTAGTALSSTLSLSQEPAAHQRPKMKSTVSPYESSAASSRNQSPAPPASKPPPSASGSLIADYLPNVKSKAARGGASRQGNPGGTSTKGSAVTTSTNNIADLTAAIAALEVSTNPTSSKERNKCDCNALLHPLFTPAPNCLKCGKIICSLEGLQPCSFCGSPILDSSEIQGMIKELKMERGNEKMRAHNEGRHYDGGSTRATNSSSETTDKLDAAKAHRDKLLAFQAQNAQRTRVVDETADFETPNVGSTQWMSPAQRALALKKQQRVLRDMEERARPEWEKNKTVMSLDIKGGKVVRTYQKGPSEAATPEEDDPEELDEPPESSGIGGQGGRGAFGRNPLLTSGSLVRPVWKAPESKLPEGAGGESPHKKRQTWRRVQDDNDDNEQWILDGGLHGYEG